MSKTITATQLQKLHAGLTFADASILAPQLNEYFVPLKSELFIPLKTQLEADIAQGEGFLRSVGKDFVAEVAKEPVVVAIEQGTTEIVAAIEENSFVKETTNG